MKIYYSPYLLNPLKRANRLSSLDPKPGVLLKGVLGNKVTFADYFPHQPLGDRSCDQFLSEFKYQKDEYDRKVFDLLLRDHGFQSLKYKSFHNHQLWTGIETIEADVIKYKLLRPQDKSFMICLEQGKRLRLDGNAMFKREDYIEFLKEIPEKYLHLIEYMEDPLCDKDWSGLKMPSASDFIEGSHFQYYIYKPNCEFLPKTDAKIIFSSYLGSDLGRWHAYCEVVENADTSIIQGIISEGFYKEENSFLTGSYKTGFIAVKNKVNRIYNNASVSKWKLLCSI